MRTEKLKALEVTRAMRKREPGMLGGLDMSRGMPRCGEISLTTL